jgi:hypothetical protein
MITRLISGIPVIVFPKVKDGNDGLSANDLVDTLRSDASLFHFLLLHLTFII